MSKLKQDFAKATESQQIKYCANVIEEASLSGKSAQKIKDMLLKTGADEHIISAAYDILDSESLPTEIQKALAHTENMISSLKAAQPSGQNPDSETKSLTPKEIRKILSKLSYMGFEEEIIYEIMEKLSESAEI